MHTRAQQVLTELLVLRAQAGQRDALPLLVPLWHEHLLRHAQRMANNHEAAKDITQDSWLDISRTLHSLEDPSRFAPWAYRIVTLKSALWIRQQSRRRTIEQNAATE